MNLATVPLASIIILILAVVGGVVVIVHPETLTFGQYLKYIGPAAGILGIGRGLDANHKP